MAKRKLQFGRIMVEMLGVLAIIGVLSIGGLSAYRFAMERIQMNTLKSWLSGMEFAFFENCHFGESENCIAEGGAAYIKARNILCNSMGSDYCADTTMAKQVYVPLKFIPNIQWATQVRENNTWNVYFTHLTDRQCELFFQMDLPKNVISVITSLYSVNRNALTANQKQQGIAKCKSANVPMFALLFSME